MGPHIRIRPNPEEIALVNGQLAQMTRIRSEARRLRFAHFELEELYGAPTSRGRSRGAVMTSAERMDIFQPGWHARALRAQRVIAEAAARAILRRYLFDVRREHSIAN